MKCDQLILGRIVSFDTDDMERMYVDAMAVKDGRIVYIGSEELARRLCDEKTRVLDYGENIVYPGFMEAHAHGLMAGVRLAFECDLLPGKSMQDYCEIMRKYIADNPGREYYSGAGWVQYEEPLAAMLDEICPDKAVYLTSFDAHSMWLNSKALEECGYDAAKAKEMGAVIHVDADGNPSGMVSESAAHYARGIHKYSVSELKEGLLAWQDFAFKQGITGAAEACLDMYEGGLEAYTELGREGKWKLRTYAYPTLPQFVLKQEYEKAAEALKEMQKQYNSGHFKVAGYKLILDGVVEAHTAYFDEEYADQPGYHGVLNLPDQESVDELVLAMNRAGIPVHAHAIGDGAVRIVLDAYEKAELETCNFDIRNIICHLQCVHKEDIRRFADFSVIAVVAPLWVPVEHPVFDTEIAYLGEERAWYEYPIASFTEAGATICFHSDYPVSPNINPALSIYTAVKRADPEKGPSSVKNPDEGIKPLQALLASTANCAYMWRVQDELGFFAVGMRADATVFDKDFLTRDDLESISGIKLVATVIDGDEVYRAE